MAIDLNHGTLDMAEQYVKKAEKQGQLVLRHREFSALSQFVDAVQSIQRWAKTSRKRYKYNEDWHQSGVFRLTPQ